MDQESTSTRALRERLQWLSADRRHRCAEEVEEALEALRRLDEGTYGSCADCELVIPEKRLRARPEATRCIDCQSVREQQVA